VIASIAVGSTLGAALAGLATADAVDSMLISIAFGAVLSAPTVALIAGRLAWLSRRPYHNAARVVRWYRYQESQAEGTGDPNQPRVSSSGGDPWRRFEDLWLGREIATNSADFKAYMSSLAAAAVDLGADDADRAATVIATMLAESLAETGGDWVSFLAPFLPRIIRFMPPNRSMSTKQFIAMYRRIALAGASLSGTIAVALVLLGFRSL